MCPRLPTPAHAWRLTSPTVLPGTPPTTEVILLLLESGRQPQGLRNVSVDTFTTYHVLRLSKDFWCERETAGLLLNKPNRDTGPGAHQLLVSGVTPRQSAPGLDGIEPVFTLYSGCHLQWTTETDGGSRGVIPEGAALESHQPPHCSGHQLTLPPGEALGVTPSNGSPARARTLRAPSGCREPVRGQVLGDPGSV